MTKNEWRNQLAFPAIVASSLISGYLLKNLWLILVAAYFLIVILFKKQKRLFLISVCLVTVLLLRVNWHPLPDVSKIAEKELVTTIDVWPDTIKVNGDQVSFEGKLSHWKVNGYYQVNTPEEKTAWSRRCDQDKRLKVKGSFYAPESARNLHGFDQAWYDFSTDHLGTFHISEIITAKKAGPRLWLRKGRAICIDWVETHYEAPIVPYIHSLLLGYRNASFQEIRDLYSTSGVLHLFTISGLHLYLFYGWLFYFFRKSQLTFGEFGLFFTATILFLVILFGATLSVWRATLFYLIGLFLKEKAVHLATMDQFSLVLLALLLLDPKTLIQVSGLLSVGMSAILLFVGQKQERPFDNIRLSLEISLLITPFIIYYFFDFPILGGLLTSLLVPLFTGTFLPLCLGSCLLTFIGWQNNLLTLILAQLIDLLEKGLAITGSFHFITGQPSLWLVVGGLILSLLLYQSRHQKWFFLPILLMMLQQSFSPLASVSFVDVGQGDSIVIQTPFKREVYVVDTGGKLGFQKEAWQVKQSRSNAEYTLIPFLKGEGIRKIDGLILTHGDVDHMGDTLALTKAIPVDTIYLGWGSEENKNMQKLIPQLPKATKLREVRSGDILGNKLKMQVLSPQKKGQGENEDSVILSLAIHQTRFLLMGDLDQAGENAILRTYPHLKTDVIKLGHHGSKTSSGAAFIAAIAPKQAIVSCGLNNSFHHPNQEVLTILDEEKVQVFRTDQEGMIRYTWTYFDNYPQVTVQKKP